MVFSIFLNRNFLLIFFHFSGYGFGEWKKIDNSSRKCNFVLIKFFIGFFFVERDVSLNLNLRLRQILTKYLFLCVDYVNLIGVASVLCNLKCFQRSQMKLTAYKFWKILFRITTDNEKYKYERILRFSYQGIHHKMIKNAFWHISNSF